MISTIVGMALRQEPERRYASAELGSEAAINLARDPCRLLTTYNLAANEARDAGRDAYLFDAELAQRLEAFESRAEPQG